MGIEDLRKNNLIIFEAFRGSFVYGTYIEGVSDKDMCGIYIQPLEDIIGFNKYVPQVQDKKGDCVYYEVGRLFELLALNNPNILEILNTPDEFVIYKHPVFDLILKEKEKFITKKCALKFGGYAHSQLAKASHQDKLMNWDKQKTMRKNPIDFCYVIDGYKTKSLKYFLKKNNYEQLFCGVVNISHARDVFALFYDEKAHLCFAKCVDEEDREHNKRVLKEKGEAVGLGYKGLAKEGSSEGLPKERGSDNAGTSNALRLSSVPKGEKPVCIFTYLKDSFSAHCKEYNKYKNWLKTRNLQRWVDVENHGQKSEEKNSLIDGKNMLHCARLIEMAIEIAEGKGIIVRRPNAQELLDIRRGKVDLNTLIKSAEEKIKKMDEIFKTSNLPDDVDYKFVNELLIKVRKEFYEI